MIRLRPHHLLCMLTYVGNGYSPEFTANFTAIARRLAAGLDSGQEFITLVAGPDDICAPLLCSTDAHCTLARVETRDRQAAEALTKLLGEPIEPGARMQLTPHHLASLRAAFAAGTIRRACEGCQWKPLCDGIAQQGFAGTLLPILAEPPDPPSEKLRRKS